MSKNKGTAKSHTSTSPNLEWEPSLDKILPNLSGNGSTLLPSDKNDDPPAIGLDAQYNQLRSLLRKGLLHSGGKTEVRNGDGMRANKRAKSVKNTVILLIGPPGKGKRIVLNKVLSSLEQECHLMSSKGKKVNFFRVITLEGLLLRKGNDSLAVNEIVLQLGQIAAKESASRLGTKTTITKHCQSSFHSNLSNLSEALMRAKVDSIPLLILLYNMDLFVAPSTSTSAFNSDRQMLIYHLLDRAASHNANIHVVGITTRLSTVDFFEKRVRSRATGNQHIISFNSLGYETMVEAVLSKFGKEDHWFAKYLKDTLRDILRNEDDGTRQDDDPQSTTDYPSLVREIFQRHHNLGKDTRWFCRVITTALGLMRTEHQIAEHPSKNGHPLLKPEHLLLALQYMYPSSSKPTNYQNHDTSFSSMRSYIHILTELTAPQVALLLSAKRILTRNSSSERPSPPLTLHQMVNEYQLNFAKKHDGVHFSHAFLRQAFLQLMECDVFKPANDHSGGGAMTYLYKSEFICFGSTTNGKNMLDDEPLDILVNMEKALGLALKNGWLHCSTALRDWGMRFK